LVLVVGCQLIIPFSSTQNHAFNVSRSIAVVV
jgi:hypothetical protein